MDARHAPGIRGEDQSDRRRIQRYWEEVLLERGAETVIIVGKNNPKLRATELELGSFGKVITRNTDITDSLQLDVLLAEIGFHPIDGTGDTAPP